MTDKARYWNIDDIQPLPKRLYKKFYGKDYSDNWKLRFSGLSESEKATLLPILNQVGFKEIYWVPEVEVPEKMSTSDLWGDGKRIEIKKVTSKRSIESQISSAAKQIGDDGWVILDSSKSELSKREILTEVERRLSRKGINKYALVSNNKVLTFKQKSDQATATYAGNDSRSPYTSILSPNPKKVNSEMQKPSMATIKSDDYWIKRSTERMGDAEKLSISHLKQVQKEYRATAKYVVEQVRNLYATYYRKSGNTFDFEALKQVAPQGDVKRFLASMEAKGLSTQLPSNYQGRMSRLELLNGQILGKVKEMAAKERVVTTDLYDKVFRNTYYRTGYDTSKGLGETLAFGTLDDKTVDKVLESKFYGRNYSERIWGNSDRLASQLQSIISQAIATGQSSEKTARLIRKRFNVSQSNAARLVRTETCYFENQAEIEAYKEMGISEYVILATLDSRTSKICREMDGKRFKIEEAVAGKTLPPLHPYCRTAIRPYIGVEFEPKTRIMRDPETGKNKTIDQMTFGEWSQKYLVEPKRSQKATKRRVLARSMNQKTTKDCTPAPIEKDNADINNKENNMSAKNNKYTPYTGKIINNREDIHDFVTDLYNMDDEIAQRFFQLITNKIRSAPITSLNQRESIIFSKIASVKINANAQVVITQNDIRHLLNSGHITGTTKNGEKRIRKLSAKDLSEIKAVIKRPDSAISTQPNSRNGNKRLVLEKQIDNNHRLVLEVDKKTGNLRVVTYFNIKKRKRTQ